MLMQSMAKSRRRIEVSTSTPGISNNFIDLEFVNDAMVNLHGYRAHAVLEPQDADANANGIWAVWVLPGKTIQNADLPVGFGDFGDEDRAVYMWGIGTFAATNQTPGIIEFAPGTTRNMARDSRIVLQIFIQGVSAGLVRLNTVQTGFVSAVV